MFILNRIFNASKGTRKENLTRLLKLQNYLLRRTKTPLTIILPYMKIREAHKLNEVKITYKRSTVNVRKITSSRDAENIFRELLADEMDYRENFFVLSLNNSNEVLEWMLLSTGGMTGTVVDVRLLFQMLLKTHATAFIVAHNHPSGSLRASQADLNITEKMKKAGQTLDIKLLDHLILTSQSYLSFADDGILK